MKTPKISIIIPVYNVENYLVQCLESVINQSYKDIEIICVNDCSTDNSLDILKKYSNSDGRITIVDKAKNEGLLLARKSGVACAKGEYIVFLDSDDYIREDLCEFIVNYSDRDFDILQFSIDVEDNTDGSKNALWLKNALQPSERQLKNAEIMKEAYINRSYVTSLVGKVFSAELCKKVYSIVPDEHCYVGEDIFTYFIFSCLAKSYIGIKTPGYYVYRYGLGVGNNEMVELPKFEMYCKMSNWVKYAHQYLDENNGTENQYYALNKMAQRMCEDCCKLLKNRIDKKEKDAASEIFVRYWDEISVTKNVVNDKLGIYYEKMKQQIDVPVYCNYAKAYDDSTKPLVSVVIPVYNVEMYIKECINSVLNQTLKYIEIICVNDGSQDNCLEIIEKYAKTDDRITVVSRKNGGLSAARNTGIEHARGKYIYFLDSDDYIVNDALEKLYLLSEKENLDLLYFGVDNYYENKELEDNNNSFNNYYARKKFFDNAVNGAKLFSRFINENMFVSSVPLQFIRKNLITDNELSFEEGILHEDELFSPQLILQAENAMVIEDKLYIRRIRESSIMTSKPTYKNFLGYFTVYILLTNLLLSKKITDKISRDALLLYIRKIYNSSIRVYKQLSEIDRKKIDDEVPKEFVLFYQPIKENEKIISSKPYKVGMIITYVPRKICAVIKAYKNYGIKGTISLIKKYYKF